MYCVDQSLVVHVNNPSLMNGSLRTREPMQTLGFIDGSKALERLIQPRTVQASLATVPSRRKQLQTVVKNLLPQVDRLRVYLNNYDGTPDFLLHPNIDLAHSTHHGDLKDTGKFFWGQADRGYVLTCDDDLLYPPNYVARLLAAVECYGKFAVIGFHGVFLKPDCHSYYRDRTVFHFTQQLKNDHSVHIVGTGCAAWHTDCLRVGIDAFPVPHMSDIWLGRICQQRELPVLTPARDSHWLNAQPVADSIYDKYFNDDGRQTGIVNELGNWRIFPKPKQHQGTGEGTGDGFN